VISRYRLFYRRYILIVIPILNLHKRVYTTFFIDEVGDMSPSVQAKLLRVIETGLLRRLGDTHEIKVNVWFISATNKDIEEESTRKVFRADLFYRLSAFSIQIPPLRERKEDIPLLVNHFLSRIEAGREPKTVSSGALRLLMNFPWPGNVRQLANVLERTVLLSTGDREIKVDNLPLEILSGTLKRIFEVQDEKTGQAALLEDLTKQRIAQVLKATGGNKSLAARLIGISRAGLYKKLRGVGDRKENKPPDIDYGA
jgi:DNA-binding NtrC family response regulator